jgi:hypothetical protein
MSPLNTFLIVLECGAPVCYCLNKLTEKKFKEGAHRGKPFLACADGTCTYQVLTWALAQVPLPTIHYLAPPTPGMCLCWFTFWFHIRNQCYFSCNKHE